MDHKLSTKQKSKTTSTKRVYKHRGEPGTPERDVYNLKRALRDSQKRYQINPNDKLLREKIRVLTRLVKESEAMRATENTGVTKDALKVLLQRDTHIRDCHLKSDIHSRECHLKSDIHSRECHLKSEEVSGEIFSNNFALILTPSKAGSHSSSNVGTVATSTRKRNGRGKQNQSKCKPTSPDPPSKAKPTPSATPPPQATVNKVQPPPPVTVKKVQPLPPTTPLPATANKVQPPPPTTPHPSTVKKVQPPPSVKPRPATVKKVQPPPPTTPHPATANKVQPPPPTTPHPSTVKKVQPPPHSHPTIAARSPSPPPAAECMTDYMSLVAIIKKCKQDDALNTANFYNLELLFGSMEFQTAFTGILKQHISSLVAKNGRLEFENERLRNLLNERR
jgi:regulator of replication initiation timing